MGTTADKLTYLNETKEQIKSILNTPYNVFRDYPTLISKYVQNQPKSIVEGSSAICENAVDLPCNVIVNGNSYQETTEGYNFYNIGDVPETTKNGVTYSIKNGRFKANGTVTGEFGITTKDMPFDLESGDYTFGAKAVSGTITGTLGKYVSKAGTNIIDGGKIQNTVNATLSENYTDLYAYLWVAGGTVFNNYETDIMLVKGTYTSGTFPPFEPYTNGVATPNTNHKQDIEEIDGFNRVKIDDLNSTLNGTTIDVKDNIIKFNGTSTIPTRIGVSNNFLIGNFKKGTYRIDLNKSGKVTLTGTYDLAYYLRDKDNNVIWTTSEMAKTFSGTFTLEEDADLYFSSYTNTANCVLEDLTLKLAIYEGTSEKPYLPYGHIGLVQRGKNRLDVSKLTEITTDKGLTAVYNKENKSIIMNGTITADNATVDINISLVKKLRFTKGITKVFVKKIGGTVSGTGGIFRAFVDGWNKSISIAFDDNLTSKVGIYNQESGLGYSCSFRFDTGIVLNNFEVQVMVTDLEDTTFEPYIEPKTIPINLAGHKLAKSNDTIRDLLKISTNGNISLTKKTIVINDKDSIVRQSTEISGKYRWYINNSKGINTDTSTNKNGGFSNITSLITQGKTWACVEGFTVASGKICLYLEELSEMTLEEVKTKLEELNAYFLLPLAEEYYETIDLPSIEPIELFEGTNIFELVTNLGTTMAVEYIVNAETLQNEITELSNAVIELGGTL